MFLFAARFWKSLILLSLMVLSACQIGSQDNELHGYVQSVLARKGVPLEKLTFPQMLSQFIYSKQNSRDPFRPFFVLRGEGPDVKRPKEALEFFALDSLKVVGTLSRNHKDWAIVHSPNDMVYLIGVGDHLGQNFGKVMAIHPEGIELTEFLPTSEGSWEERQTTMDITQET